MTQVWKGTTVVPVTVIKAEPNTVSLLRTKERDGYEAVQLSLGKERREVALAFLGEHSLGDTITVAEFKEGDHIAIRGTTKGRGFQGVVKRHGFHGGPKTHGQKNRHRAPGSIGSTAPQRVFPGRKMAGRMGGDQVMVKNLKVVAVDPETHTLMVKGAVPGARGTLLLIERVDTKK